MTKQMNTNNFDILYKHIQDYGHMILNSLNLFNTIKHETELKLSHMEIITYLSYKTYMQLSIHNQTYNVSENFLEYFVSKLSEYADLPIKNTWYYFNKKINDYKLFFNDKDQYIIDNPLIKNIMFSEIKYNETFDPSRKNYATSFFVEQSALNFAYLKSGYLFEVLFLITIANLLSDTNDFRTLNTSEVKKRTIASSKNIKTYLDNICIDNNTRQYLQGEYKTKNDNDNKRLNSYNLKGSIFNIKNWFSG